MLVVFAKEEEVDVGGKVDFIHKLSTFDRFNFPEQPILFFHNSDPECKKERNLEGDEPALVMYVSKDTTPFTKLGDKDEISFNSIYHWISMSISLTKMDYRRRTLHLMQNLNYNAIVYIKPD